MSYSAEDFADQYLPFTESQIKKLGSPIDSILRGADANRSGFSKFVRALIRGLDEDFERSVLELLHDEGAYVDATISIVSGSHQDIRVCGVLPPRTRLILEGPEEEVT